MTQTLSSSRRCVCWPPDKLFPLFVSTHFAFSDISPMSDQLQLHAVAPNQKRSLLTPTLSTQLCPAWVCCLPSNSKLCFGWGLNIKPVAVISGPSHECPVRLILPPPWRWAGWTGWRAQRAGVAPNHRPLRPPRLAVLLQPADRRGAGAAVPRRADVAIPSPGMPPPWPAWPQLLRPAR